MRRGQKNAMRQTGPCAAMGDVLMSADQQCGVHPAVRPGRPATGPHVAPPLGRQTAAATAATVACRPDADGGAAISKTAQEARACDARPGPAPWMRFASLPRRAHLHALNTGAVGRDVLHTEPCD
jgi:hypothetical protein